MGIVLTEAMMHVITESIADYYDASMEYKASYADRMAGAISAVLYIAEAELKVSVSTVVRRLNESEEETE